MNQHNKPKPELNHHHVQENSCCESTCGDGHALSHGGGLLSEHQHHNHSGECCSASPKVNSATTISIPLPEGTNRVRYRIENMDCPTEEQLIRNKLEPMQGIVRLDFNLLDRELTVHHQLDDPQSIVSALIKLLSLIHI